MSKRKIINDPVYGLISFPDDLIYDIIGHKYFQRLRRISQMGLSTYVYPGATHSRFSHALGALHLMTVALDTLKSKGITISDQEVTGVCLAILLHDLGHGPFSHALEHIIIDKTHESISLELMEKLNVEFEGRLDIAIAIFSGNYPRKFLKQLVSSQLDMDRMDYLTRDSYFSGVAEGVIGYKRIISMLNVVNDELVIEEKGIFSIEKFLVARHIMYWQVYLHKTSIAGEQMLKSFVLRLKDLIEIDPDAVEESRLKRFYVDIKSKRINEDNYLDEFITLDDIDIYSCLKTMILSQDSLLKIFSNSILNRNLFTVMLDKNPIKSDLVQSIRQKVKQRFNLKDEIIENLIIQGQESSTAYDVIHEEIKVLDKSGSVKPISDYLDVLVNVRKITKYYIIYPLKNGNFAAIS